MVVMKMIKHFAGSICIFSLLISVLTLSCGSTALAADVTEGLQYDDMGVYDPQDPEYAFYVGGYDRDDPGEIFFPEEAYDSGETTDNTDGSGNISGQDSDASSNGDRSQLYLSKRAYNATVISGLDGNTYTCPAYAEGKKVNHGVDVSRWQTNIDWSGMKASGVDFAIIRAGFRSAGDGSMGVDPYLSKNIENAYAAGVKVGIYFFSQACTVQEAIEEAEYCYSIIKDYAGKISLPVFMDYEYSNYYDSSVGGYVNGRLKVQHAQDASNAATSYEYKSGHSKVVNAFCDTISKYGFNAGVYANRSMLTSQMYVSEVSSQYHIWLANYASYTPYADRLSAWQYCSDNTNLDAYINIGDSRYNSSGTYTAKPIDSDFWFGELPTASYNSVDTTLAAAFVTRLYKLVLQREPDEAGLSDWVNRLTTGQSSAADLICGFYNSDEMNNRGLSYDDFVEIAYQGIMYRASDESGKEYWVSRLNTGVSNTYILQGFCNSKEFNSLCTQYGISQGTITCTEGRDLNYGITGFVSRLYTKALERGYDVSGLNDWCQRINQDPSRDNVLAVSVEGFLHSEEFTNKNLSDSDYVKCMYRTFLDREYEQEGYESWLKKLAEGMSRDEVARGFAYSTEFGNIMSEYGL